MSDTGYVVIAFLLVFAVGVAIGFAIGRWWSVLVSPAIFGGWISVAVLGPQDPRQASGLLGSEYLMVAGLLGMVPVAVGVALRRGRSRVQDSIDGRRGDDA